MAPDQIWNLASTGIMAGVLLFAVVVGGKAERWGAGATFLAVILTWTAQYSIGPAVVSVKLAIDAALALAFGVMVFRWKLLWLGMAGCAQSLLLAFTGSRMVNFPLSEAAYLYALNLSSLTVFASIAYGGWAYRWGRGEEDYYQRAVPAAA